jgi:hypothetical protein
MPNTRSYDTRKALMDYSVYVPLGAAKVLFETSKDLSRKAWEAAQTSRQEALKTYEELARRGEKLATSIRRSVYTRRAVDQTKMARTQVEGVGKQAMKASTSVRKAAGSTAQAARAAARKVG